MQIKRGGTWSLDLRHLTQRPLGGASRSVAALPSTPWEEKMDREGECQYGRGDHSKSQRGDEDSLIVRASDRETAQLSGKASQNERASQRDQDSTRWISNDDVPLRPCWARDGADIRPCRLLTCAAHRQRPRSPGSGQSKRWVEIWMSVIECDACPGKGNED